MNIFKQYGIREVADVVFYSINRIGDEEFYVPVLYFDTLKVSTLDKSVNVVNAKGGPGNGKILSWSFDKDIKLKLEDALFSQTSLDMFLNGRVMAKMSAWTSAIAKLSVANKYGQKHYSTKAYPSPELTDEEWEIVYRCAQRAGFDPRTGYSDNIGASRLANVNNTCKYVYNDKEAERLNPLINAMVAENRWLLKDRYTKRKQKTPHSRDISPYFDYNANKYESVSIVVKEKDKEQEKAEALRVHEMQYGDKYIGTRNIIVTFKSKEGGDLERRNSFETGYGTIDIAVQMRYSIQKLPEGFKCLYAYLTADNMESKEDDKGFTTLGILLDIFTGYNKVLDRAELNPTLQIGNEFLLNHILYYVFPNYLEDAIDDLCWCDMQGKSCTAMPQKVIDLISDEIDVFSKIGQYENDLYEATHIDRFQKATVEERDGLKIDIVEQAQNIKKLYNNEMSTFTVFYDSKTMAPFISETNLDDKILSQKCVRIYKEEAPLLSDCLAAIKSYLRGQYDDDWIDSLTIKDCTINKIVDEYGTDITERRFSAIADGENVISQPIGGTETVIYDQRRNHYLVYFNINKRDYITLKKGTVYYKWSRVIDEDVNDITFLGTNIAIDCDQFPGEYMIVGETQVRVQQTGKDEPVQFIINRAAISASTKIQLQASGQPTTFSIDVDVLQPRDKKKQAMNLIMFNETEDKVEGGTKVIPQSKHHATTQPVKIQEEIIGKNIEIY